jgi:hypothetical protein
VWRTGGRGYTYAGNAEAWVLPFEEAQKCVASLGPEKQAAFIRVIAADPKTLRRVQPDRDMTQIRIDAAELEQAYVNSPTPGLIEGCTVYEECCIWAAEYVALMDKYNALEAGRA